MERARADHAAWPSPRTITLAYLLFGVGWIVVTDWAVTAALGGSSLAVGAQLAKGLLFVAGSGAFVYGLLRRRERSLRERAETIRRERSAIRGLESDVREGEQLLEVILENVMETVLLTDAGGRFTYVCSNVSYIFGHSPEAVRDMGTVDSLLGEDFLPAALEPDDSVENVEREIVDADGDEHTVLVTARAVDVEAGSVLYSVRDITDRKAQEERFRAYVENSSDVFVVLDDRRAIEYVSPAVDRVLGYDPDDLDGRDVLDVVHPDDREALVDALAAVDARPAGATVSEQYRTRHADGSWVWTESRLMTYAAGEAGRYVLNTRDVSELREREGRLSVLDRVLRHNIRNKLNIVLGHARQLRERADPDEEEELAVVVEAAESLLGLSEKARRFDSIIRRREEAVEVIDLVSTTEHVVAEKRVEYPDVSFTTRFPAEARVEVHEALELALAELVDNAVIHAGDGDASVDIEVAVEGTMASVRVADRGPGLPRVDRAVVTKGVESPLEHSLNIGLWLVRWTVENSGGDLAVGENEPSGTAVVIRLPLASEGEAE